MKLNEKRIELLKNGKVILHNTTLVIHSDLLNQIIMKCVGYNKNLLGSSLYYKIFKRCNNSYDYNSYDNIMNWMTEGLLIKPISWFFEEEINNILILI